ncbi:MAG: 50S ribosomal protein L10 [Candidatus Woesearchaeota archaeon]
MTGYKPKISESKRKDIEEIKKLSQEYKVLAIANLKNLPAFNLMKIKSKLKGKLILKYTKKRLMKIAFDELEDKKLSTLKERLEGIPALIFTNEEPFKLFQLLKKSKTPALAKPGDIAPKDVIIAEGPTDFTPGPMIGELGSMGIKTAVEAGKITIKSEKLFVQEGQEINNKQAELMAKLGLEPMEIGMNLVLTYENGEILERKVLDIDTEKMFQDLKTAAGEGIALAIYLSYPTKETIGILIKKAQLEALALEKEYESKVPQKPKVEEKLTEPQEAKPVEPSPKPEETPTQTEQTETKQEKEEPLEKEVEQAIEKEIKEEKPKETVKQEKTEEKKETYDQRQANEEMMKKAQEKIKELTTKKIKGEL